MMFTPPRKVPTKGVKKKVKSKPNEASARRIPSLRERIDSQFLDNQSSPKKYSLPKRKGAHIDISPCFSVPTPTRVPKLILVPTTYDPSSPIHYMPKFMRPFIEKIVDVKGNENCGFKDIVEPMGFMEESCVMVRRAHIQEVKEHMNHYMRIYVGEDRYNYILN
ncbi:hypothetical protein MTR_2g060930 [Medicago truncatula]|uniref:Uncharacterized protein n=1 Tax=Medicago truncatula TaxID=3880 RepID=G7IJ22_MEDTR|nr:hypothetical protein MTR_2g060930 [Medicago truncatula]